jgi:hypothetical protein
VGMMCNALQRRLFATPGDGCGIDARNACPIYPYRILSEEPCLAHLFVRSLPKLPDPWSLWRPILDSVLSLFRYSGGGGEGGV